MSNITNSTVLAFEETQIITVCFNRHGPNKNRAQIRFSLLSLKAKHDRLICEHVYWLGAVFIET